MAIRTDYWPVLGGYFLLIAAVTALAFRTAANGRLLLLTVAVLLSLRVALVENPLSWSLYAQRLDPYLVGWRQYSLVRVQRDSYIKADSPRFIAVGSSQTDAVFGSYAMTHDELETFSVAAMMPFDFVLYSDEIFRRRPATIVLYLSAFDIAKEPSPEAMVLVPRQGLEMLSLAGRVRALSPGGEYDRAATELLIGEVIPEFKYRFVFRGLVEREFQRVARRLGDAAATDAPPSTLEERIGWLRDSLDTDHIAFNLYWLRRFLHDAGKNGIEVVIAEGHYSPLVDSRETILLNDQTRGLLEATALGLTHVRFVPRAAVYEFTTDDYADLTHVAATAGERYAESLMRVIRSTPGDVP